MGLAVTQKTVTGTAAKTVTLVDPTSVRTVQHTARKRRGHFGISIESVSSGSPGSLTMMSRNTGITHSSDPFNLGTLYTTDERGGATYDVTVCNNVSFCSAFVVVY